MAGREQANKASVRRSTIELFSLSTKAGLEPATYGLDGEVTSLYTTTRGKCKCTFIFSQEKLERCTFIFGVAYWGGAAGVV